MARPEPEQLRGPRRGLDADRGHGAQALCGDRAEAGDAYRKPGSSRLASFGPENVNGVPTVFAVLSKRVGEGCGASGTGCSSAEAERQHRLGARRRRRARRRDHAHRGRPLRPARHPLRSRPPGAERDRRDRLAADADTHGELLRQPAARAGRRVRTVRARRDRDLGVLRGAYRLDPGRSDRDSRDEPARPARRGRLERLHPRPQRPSPEALRANARRHPGYRPA